LEEYWISWKRKWSHRWNMDTWFLIWRFVLDLRMLGLRGDNIDGLDLEVHMDYDGALDHWSLWRMSIEEISWIIYP
jgi:hypothetical protein